MLTVTHAPAQAAYETAVQREMLAMARKSSELIHVLQKIEERLIAGQADDALVLTVEVLDRWNPKVGA